jgi:hypothetical protein
MVPTELDPYARLSLRDRLELLAFEARLAGFPESLMAVWGTLACLGKRPAKGAPCYPVPERPPSSFCRS